MAIIGWAWILGLMGTSIEVSSVAGPRPHEGSFMAAIVSQAIPQTTQFYCTGFLVSTKAVLTACKCIGKFTLNTQLRFNFEPIDFQYYAVILGIESFDPRGPQKGYLRKIGEVRPFEECTYDKKFGFLRDLGAIILEKELTIEPNHHITLAPSVMTREARELEMYILEMVYNQATCTVWGFGSKSEGASDSSLRNLTSSTVKLITFIKCRGLICPLGRDVYCLLNIDIANNQEMCSAADDWASNCKAGEGSPLICEKRLMGVVRYVNCSTPMLVTRIGTALPFYLELVGGSQSVKKQSNAILPNVLIAGILLYSK